MSKNMIITITDLPNEDSCNIKVEVSCNMDKNTAKKMIDNVINSIEVLTQKKISKLPIKERDTA